jgi:hypothetical protein
MTPADLARHAEQVASDAAYTRCAAEEIRLRRLLAERAIDPAQELQGELSYSEDRIARRFDAESA